MRTALSFPGRTGRHPRPSHLSYLVAIVVAGVLSQPGVLAGRTPNGDGSLVGHGKRTNSGLPSQSVEQASPRPSSGSPTGSASSVRRDAWLPGEVSENSLRTPLDQPACTVCLEGAASVQWTGSVGSFHVDHISNYESTPTGSLDLKVVLVSPLPEFGSSVNYWPFSDSVTYPSLAAGYQYSNVDSGTIYFHPGTIPPGAYWALLYLREYKGGSWYYDDWTVILGAVKCNGTSCSGVPCLEDAKTMCLIGGRYSITSQWKNQYAGGVMSDLYRTTLTDATGAFWLTDSSTYEYLIRIQTATPNGYAWIAIPTFTDVEFWITVEDLFDSQGIVYHSLPGNRTLIYDPYAFIFP